MEWKLVSTVDRAPGIAIHVYRLDNLETKLVFDDRYDGIIGVHMSFYTRKDNRRDIGSDFVKGSTEDALKLAFDRLSTYTYEIYRKGWKKVQAWQPGLKP